MNPPSDRRPCLTLSIQTQRLLLRPFRREDAGEAARMCGNERVSKSTLSLPHPYPTELAVSWIDTHAERIRSGAAYPFAITDRQTGTLYGCIELSCDSLHRHGELGYWCGEEYWGRGYATEAASAVIAFAFDELHLHRVLGRHFASNPASGRVLEKAGMQREGVQKGHLFRLGTFEDVVLYGVLNPAE